MGYFEIDFEEQSTSDLLDLLDEFIDELPDDDHDAEELCLEIRKRFDDLEQKLKAAKRPRPKPVKRKHRPAKISGVDVLKKIYRLLPGLTQDEAILLKKQCIWLTT
ncbi:MAG: hypothetical protein HQK56_10085 [Deltaproteobacteria bacterium]|nr:hypothetical protein [Deltaproteobacteria bacterium]